MQVEELIGFIEWLDQEVRQPNLVNLYQQLHKRLNQNAQPAQQKQPFESQKTALIQGVLAVHLPLLNDTQMRFAEDIGLLDLVGERAQSQIEDVLYKNAIDIATAAQKINDFQNTLNSILGKMAQVAEGLKPYVKATTPEYAEALIHIRFQRDAAIKNVVDLKKWGEAWHEIGRGVALANKLPPEDIRIIGASRGSIIYHLAVAYGVANTLTAITLLVLKVADRVLELRRKAEEIRGMRLSNDKAALELEKEADKIRDEGRAEVLKSVKATKKLDGEQETALSNAITRIFEFVAGGGDIDVHIQEAALDDVKDAPPNQPDQKKVIGEIKQSFREIQRIEAKLHLLNDKNP